MGKTVVFKVLLAMLMAVFVLFAPAGVSYGAGGQVAANQNSAREQHQHLGQGQPQHEERERHRYREEEKMAWGEEKKSVWEKVYRGVENALLHVKNPVARAALEAIRDGRSVAEAVYEAKPLLKEWVRENAAEVQEVVGLLVEELKADETLDKQAKVTLLKEVGGLLRELEISHRARSLWEEVLTLDPNDEEAYRELDKAFAKMGNLAVKIFLRGKPLAFDVPPQVENGRTLVPVRALAEGLGARVSYENGLVTIAHRGATVVLKPGSSEAWVGGRLVVLEVPARVENGRTLVPLRFVSEGLGAKVNYYQESNLIAVSGDAPEM